VTHRIETNAAGEMTKRGQKAWRASLESHGTAKVRAEARAGVQAAREALRAAREHRRDRMQVAVAWCQEARAANREKIRKTRAAAMLLLREEANLVRANARAECSAAKDAIRGSAEPDLVKARLILGEERKYQAQISRSHKPVKLGAAKRATARELEQESDDAVRRNLEAGVAHLIPVFDRVRGAIRASDRISRTDAFLQWAEENPSEVLSISGEDVDRDVAEAVRAHQRAELEERRARKIRAPLGPKARELARLAESSAYRLIPSKNRGRDRGKASARTLALPTRADPVILSARELADSALGAIELERSRETPLEAEVRAGRAAAREALQLEAEREADAKFERDRADMAAAWAAKDAAKEARGQLKDSLLTRLEKAFDLACAEWEIRPQSADAMFKVDEIGRAIREANKGPLTPRARDRLEAARRANELSLQEAIARRPPPKYTDAELYEMDRLEQARMGVALRAERDREEAPTRPANTQEHGTVNDVLEGLAATAPLRPAGRAPYGLAVPSPSRPAGRAPRRSRFVTATMNKDGRAFLIKYAKEWAQSTGSLPRWEITKHSNPAGGHDYGVGNANAHYESTRLPLRYFSTRAQALAASNAAARAGHRALLSPAPF